MSALYYVAVASLITAAVVSGSAAFLLQRFYASGYRKGASDQERQMLENAQRLSAHINQHASIAANQASRLQAEADHARHAMLNAAAEAAAKKRRSN